jgi:outer membrane protein assembly factor BamB
MGLIHLARWRIPVLLALLLYLFCLPACGSHGTGAVALGDNGSGAESSAAGSGPDPPSADSVTRQQAIAQVDNCAVPAGVEPHLWAQLQDALKRTLQEKVAAQIPVAPPTGEHNRVPNIQYSGNPGEPLVLNWYYVNVGDYNQDGLVSVNDLTPLGVHFNEQSPGFPEPWQYDHEMSVIDGNGDGLISVNDITPLGANFQSRVSEYGVFASGNQGIRKLGAVSFADAYRVPNKRLSFRFQLEQEYIGDQYWVAPGDGSSYGAPSLPAGEDPVQITAVSPASGTTGQPATFSVIALGSPPFSCRWEFGAAASPSTSTEFTPEVTLGPPGSYTPRVTVSNDQGAATYDFALLSLEEGAVAGPGDWWMYGHDSRHTGRSSFVGPAAAILRWHIPDIGNWTSYSSVIGADGTVYVSGGESRSMVAVLPNGQQLWQYSTEGAVQCCPAIGEDGTLYFGSYDHLLHAVNPDGSGQWTYEFDDAVIWSSPVLDAAGIIYVGSKDGRLYAINPDGTLKWSYDTGDWVYSSPALAADGTIYIGSRDTQLHAVTSEGGLKWTFPTWGWIVGSPAVGDDGVVYFGSLDQRLYAVNPDGSQRWAYDTGAGIECAPALAADGTIYIGTGGGTQAGVGRLLALNPDGSLKWSFTTAAACSYSSPIVDAAGAIYFGCEDGKMYSLNPDGSLRWIYGTAVGVRCSPSIGPDGTLYFTSGNGEMLALGPGGGEPQPTAVEILNVDPQWGDSGEEIVLTADVRGSAPLSYNWNLGGAATPNESSAAAPSVVLGATGDYLATLTVSNDSGIDGYFQFRIIVGDGVRWTQSYYGEANDVDYDADGSIYVAGETMLFGSSLGDALVLKYSAAGELLWQRAWAGARATQVEVGVDGDIYVAGSTGSFGAGEDDVVLLKFSPAGDLLWQRTWGTAASEFTEGLALDSGELDGIEHIYISATAEIGSGNYDAALLKYAPSGDLLWQQSWGGGGDDRGGPVAVFYSVAESYEVIYQAGSTESYSAGGDDDTFLLKFTPAGGDPLWQRTWGAAYFDRGAALALDADENIYLAASHLRDLGEGPKSDVALLKYSKGGALEFASVWHEFPPEVPRAIALGAAGAIYVSGQQSITGDDSEDLFLLKFSAAGDLQWQRAWGRWDGELGSPFNLGHARGMVIDGEGDLLIAGVGGRVGLWTPAAGTAQEVTATTGSPSGAIAELSGVAMTPSGLVSVPHGAGYGDMTLMKYEPAD